MSTPNLALVLHAHLPYIRHPERPRFYEESWLFEAITETYLPILRALERLTADQVPVRLTMSVTPPLAEMLADALLRDRYARHLDALAELAADEVEQRAATPFEAATVALAQDLAETRSFHRALGGDVLAAFRRFQELGVLELITCTATHGLLPLMATDASRRAQVAIAAAVHERHFGRRPRGIWLPECAFAPGVDGLLADEGIGFFFMEKHGLLNATPGAAYGTARPVATEAGVAAFARDPECSSQIWSAESGYPGDPAYREFHRDLGYELPLDRPHLSELHSGGARHPIGLKLYRITGKVPLGEKAPYDPALAIARVQEHARHFVDSRERQLRALTDALPSDVPPFLVAPFDAELFGHWWSEGPRFLEAVFRAAAGSETVRLGTPAEFLEGDPALEVVTPSACTWGDKGYYEVWLNDENAWIYPHLHAAERRLVALVDAHPRAHGAFRRALAQLGRELLLAQSSDWAFLVTTSTAGDYPKNRTLAFLRRFEKLASDLERQTVDLPFLAECERRDAIFADLDPSAWASRSVTRPGAGSLTDLSTP